MRIGTYIKMNTILTSQILEIWAEELEPLVTDYALHFSCGERTLAERNTSTIFSSASMIKLGIADAFLSGMVDPDIFPAEMLVDWDRHGAFGDGILRGLLEPQTLTTTELVHLMLSVSDNVATNALIDYVEGVDNMNVLFSGLGYSASDMFLHGTVEGKERAALDWPPPEPASHLPTRWCLGSVTVQSLVNVLRSLSLSDQAMNSLHVQQDTRSVARYLKPTETMAWKTGAADGLVHAGGFVSLPGLAGDLLFVVLTDRPFIEADEFHSNSLDAPIFCAMGRAMRRTLDLLSDNGR